MSNISGTLTINGTTIAGTLTTAETVINGTVSTPGASITGTLNIGVGPKGDNGDSGVGVPVGGGAGQLLAKVDATDYNTEWVEAPTGGGGGASATLVTADVTRVADGAATYTDIPELTVSLNDGETKVVLYTIFYDEKSEGIEFQFSGSGTFGQPGKSYFFDISQAVGRTAKQIKDFVFTPGTPTAITYLIGDSISSSPVNAFCVRAVLHAPNGANTVRIGFKATGSGGSTIEIKQGSNLTVF